jgi:hypothetical protein
MRSVAPPRALDHVKDHVVNVLGERTQHDRDPIFVVADADDVEQEAA